MRYVAIALMLISSSAFADFSFPIVCRDNNPNTEVANNIMVYKEGENIILKNYIMRDVPAYGSMFFVKMGQDGDLLTFQDYMADLVVDAKTQRATWNGSFSREPNEKETKQGFKGPMNAYGGNVQMTCTFGVEPADLNQRWPNSFSQ